MTGPVRFVNHGCEPKAVYSAGFFGGRMLKLELQKLLGLVKKLFCVTPMTTLWKITSTANVRNVVVSEAVKITNQIHQATKSN